MAAKTNTLISMLPFDIFFRFFTRWEFLIRVIIEFPTVLGQHYRPFEKNRYRNLPATLGKQGKTELVDVSLGS